MTPEPLTSRRNQQLFLVAAVCSSPLEERSYQTNFALLTRDSTSTKGIIHVLKKRPVFFTYTIPRYAWPGLMICFCSSSSTTRQGTHDWLAAGVYQELMDTPLLIRLGRGPASFFLLSLLSLACSRAAYLAYFFSSLSHADYCFHVHLLLSPALLTSGIAIRECNYLATKASY